MAGGPSGTLGLGNGMSVLCPTALMCMIGLDMTSLAYFRSSLLMLSGPQACPLFKAFSTFLTSACLTGDCRGLGLPVKGWSGSSPASVHCSLNHSWMTSSFPWSVTGKCSSELCTASGGLGPMIPRALADLNLFWQSSVVDMVSTSESACKIERSLKRLLIWRSVLLRSFRSVVRSLLLLLW